MTVKDLRQNPHPKPRRLRLLTPLLFLIVSAGFAAPATGQTVPATPTRPQPVDTTVARRAAPFAELRGRTVEDIRIVGNTQTSPAVIRNVIRTRVGEPFDPETVAEDYQRIFQ